MHESSGTLKFKKIIFKREIRKYSKFCLSLLASSTIFQTLRSKSGLFSIFERLQVTFLSYVPGWFVSTASRLRYMVF